MRTHLLPFIVLAAATCSAWGDDSTDRTASIRAAVKRAIPMLELGSAGSATERTCFTCHNQALPVVALSLANQRGFSIDKKNFQRQLDHTKKHIAKGRENYRRGKGQGGQVITAGYALWTLDAGGRKPSANTSAVVDYLLKHQKEREHWRQKSRRPPTSGSDFTATYVALRALDRFGGDSQEDAIAERRKVVRKWLLKAVPRETEDHVFRLRALSLFDVPANVRRQAVDGLLKLQQDDGGWSQTEDMSSDAYATATVLSALLADGGVKSNSSAIEKGIDYLLESQLDDGTWLVTTRAKGFQEYFESGFPHGEDQFVSIAASSWSTMALVLALPEE